MSPMKPAWPCENVLPGMAPVAAILARTQETVVAVTGIRAYPAGFGFTLKLRLRSLRPSERRGFWPFDEFSHRRGRARDDALRFTIEFAGGRSVSTLMGAPSGRLWGRLGVCWSPVGEHSSALDAEESFVKTVPLPAVGGG